MGRAARRPGLSAAAPQRPVLIVAGPTASGKSALALDLARALGGVVINADSMQVYRELRILTARPASPEEDALAPHRLYGVLPAAEACSAARWRGLALEEIARAHAGGRLPILAGGTGLYLRALTQGLAPIPDVPGEVRRATRRRFAELGNQAFHAELAARDPVMGSRLNPGDSQRLMRAAEVIAATGRSLAEWHRAPAGAKPGPALRFFTLALLPPRAFLRERIAARFAAMLDAGALEEVRALKELRLPDTLPAMKAHGVPELMRHLGGELSLEEAAGRAVAVTRQYAKRQVTWLRHQIAKDHVVDQQYSGSISPSIVNKIRPFLLTVPE